jgi:hypothetical protein
MPCFQIRASAQASSPDLSWLGSCSVQVILGKGLKQATSKAADMHNSIGYLLIIALCGLIQRNSAIGWKRFLREGAPSAALSLGQVTIAFVMTTRSPSLLRR